MFSSIPDILADLRAGKMIVLTDDEHRENEGDLVLPAQFATPEAITFMLSVARGYMCLSMTEADCDRLDLSPQASVNTTMRGTAFTVSVDGHPRHGFTTGVSAKERARCIQMMIDPAYTVADFVRPGHINPLRSRDGGVLVRTGQTEGSVDLCRLAGLYPAAVIIEIMRDDGEMARVPDLVKVCQRHGLKMASVAQIIEHRLSGESLVRRIEPVAGRAMRTALGTFNAVLFESVVDPLPHLALTVGGVGELDGAGRVKEQDGPVLVRMHRRHLLGDVFGDLESSAEGATGDVLRASMKAIQDEGRGAIVYLRTQGMSGGMSGGVGGTGTAGHAGAAGSGQAGHSIPAGPAGGVHDEPGGEARVDLEGRLQSIRRPARVAGSDDPELSHPDSAAAGRVLPGAMRELGVGCQILRALGVSKLRLLTNHQTAMPGLEAFGLEIVERVGVGKK